MKSGYDVLYDPPPVRLTGPEKLLRIQATSGKCPQKESLFTLHSAIGFRRADNSIEIEKIAGFCHDRRMLRTYWLHRVHQLVDATTSEEIHDLATWIASKQEPDMTNTQSCLDNAPDDERRSNAAIAARSNTGPAIDEAVRFALMLGDRDIAERLFRIGGLLTSKQASGPAS